MFDFFIVAILGVFVGFASGFFGIGGGTVVVPAMMILGYDIKYAIGISIMQMVFSSFYGSYINLKHKMFDIKSAFSLGFGGFCGALSSGYIVSVLSSKMLLVALGAIQILNIIKLFQTPPQPKGEPKESKILLFIIGALVGMTAISVGIGGSILIMPILMGFLNYDIKKAVATGLFFVIFSSTAGFLSLAYHGYVHYEIGVVLGLASLIGVAFGVKISHKIERKKQKICLICLCVLILLITLKKLFLG